jgi:hypothetical protein
MEILIWFIMAYGFTNIMVYGSIFEGMRSRIKRWGDNPFNPIGFFFKFISGILSCMMCCSTWVGFYLGYFIYSPMHEFLNINPNISWFYDGLLSSGAVWAINGIIEWFEENRPSNK